MPDSFIQEKEMPEFLDSRYKCWTLDLGRWNLEAGPWKLKLLNFKLPRAFRTVKILFFLDLVIYKNYTNLHKLFFPEYLLLRI